MVASNAGRQQLAGPAPTPTPNPPTTVQKRNPRSRRIDRALLPLMGMNIQGDIGDVTCYTTRKRKLVMYAKSPPKLPASYLQTGQRNRFRRVGGLWSATPPDVKERWNAIPQRAHLRITGYNLFAYFQLTADRRAINTLMAQTGITVPI